jgi:hypothetical protein
MIDELSAAQGPGTDMAESGIREFSRFDFDQYPISDMGQDAASNAVYDATCGADYLCLSGFCHCCTLRTNQ